MDVKVKISNCSLDLLSEIQDFMECEASIDENKYFVFTVKPDKAKMFLDEQFTKELPCDVIVSRPFGTR